MPGLCRKKLVFCVLKHVMFTRAECLKHISDVLGGLYCDTVGPHLMWALVVIGAVVQAFSLLKLPRMLLKGN